MCPNASQELLDAEWLGHIIIGPDFQPNNLIGLLAARCQHDWGNVWRAGAADPRTRSDAAKAANPEIPRDLQDVCLKALEKKPENRYASAREMADDLERFLAGEKVHAVPTAYSNLMSGKIEQYLRELEGWREEEIVSEHEYEALRRDYARLVEREDSWILNARRLSLPQVSLYLGAWILTVGAALLFLFQFADLSGTLGVIVVAGTAALMADRGLRLWKSGQLRIGIAYLLAFCLLLPIALLVAFGAYHLFTRAAANPDWELLGRISKTFKQTTNAQIWWAVILSLPVYVWLRQFAKSSVFSLVFAVMVAWLWVVTLMRMGLLEWLDTDPENSISG